MVGLFFIYFIGKMYYKLADENGQNKWLYAVLGVGTYYVGLLSFGFILGFIIALFNPGFLAGCSEMGLGLMCIPFGIAACWGFYKVLKMKWEKEAAKHIEGIDDIGVDTENIS